MTTVLSTDYPTTFPLSDAGEVRVRIARMDLAQSQAFRRRYEATRERESVRRVSVRLPGEEMETRGMRRERTDAEQALLVAVDAVGLPADLPPELQALVDAARRVVADDPTEKTWVVDDAEVRRRRVAEMPPAEHEAWHALVLAEEAAEVAFITDVITAYVSLEPGQVSLRQRIVDDEGATTEVVVPVVTGADIMRAWGNKLEDLRALVALVRIENDLSDTRKKALRSLYGLGGSSPAPAEVDPVGTVPAAIAAPADAKASAGSAAATESSAT